MEVKGHPGAAPAASLLLSLQSVDWYCVFTVSPPPPREIAHGVPFIFVLDQDEFVKPKLAENWTHGEMGPTKWPRSLATCLPSFLPRDILH
jgi:hypothetical protein